MKKSAFTLIELIIVIIVAGILAAVMIPSMERDSLREATNQVVRHIQYTQHLAMVDDVYDASKVSWQKSLWAIHFRQTNNCYAVASDVDLSGQFSPAETATDPTTNELLYSDSFCTKTIGEQSNLLLEDKYNTTVRVSNGCGASYIAFDNLGRPLKTFNITDPIKSTSACLITLTSGTRNAVITIEPETGFAHLTSFDSI